jgi:WD40 repeat protein
VKYQQVSSGAILAIAYSPDKKFIASVAEDGCLYLWQLQTNKLDKKGCDKDSPGLIQSIQSMTNKARSIAFSKNSDRIIININLAPNMLTAEAYTGYPSFAILWSLEGDEWKPSHLKVPNSGSSSKVSFAAFSSDGNTIVAGGEDGSIRLLDRKGKEIGQPLLGHSSAVRSVTFSADGEKIVSNSLDGTIRLWDVEQNLSDKQSFERFGTKMILSPDGQMAAIGGLIGKQATVTLLDITGNQTGNKIGRISVGPELGRRSEDEGSSEDYQSDYLSGVPLAVSSKGYVVVVEGRNSLTLWHPGSTQERQSIGSPETLLGNIAAISPDNQRIVSTIRAEEGFNHSIHNHSIQLWDIQGNPIGQPVNDKSLEVMSIAFSFNGQQIVSGHSNSNDFVNGAASKYSVCLWDLQVKGLEKKVCEDVSGDPIKVAFSLDSKTVAIGQSDGGLRLWNLQSNEIGQRFGGNEQPVTSIAFSPDGKTLASGDNDGSVRLWNLEGTPIGRAFQSYTNQRGAVSSIAFDRDGTTMIVAYRDGNVRFWQTNLEPWLQAACDRVRDHLNLKNPGNEEERGAKKTCETYVWNTQTAQNEEVSTGDKTLQPFEAVGRLPLTSLEQSKVQPRPQNTSPPAPF